MGEEDLFSAIREQRILERAPLAARMRPQHLSEVVGQDHLLGDGAPLRRLIEADRMSSIILWGPPGTGKTTIAELIASTTQKHFERLSAVTAGVKEVREIIEAARQRLVLDARSTVVFIDEIHRFTTNQQDALLHAVESGVVVLIGATTENPSFSINSALRSRSSVFALQPVSSDDVAAVLERALIFESATADDAAVALIASRCTGDVRQALTSLEVAIAVAHGNHVSLSEATAALQTAVQRLDVDDHYAMASAFIKSMRAGHVNVALHWLARMIESGEDVRFIARRLMIFASEDIGMADHTSLLVAVAAAQAVEKIGMPEAGHHLAHAVIHLSQAPKSRTVSAALAEAVADVRSAHVHLVPPPTGEWPQHHPRGTGVPNYYRGEHESSSSNDQ